MAVSSRWDLRHKCAGTLQTRGYLCLQAQSRENLVLQLKALQDLDAASHTKLPAKLEPLKFVDRRQQPAITSFSNRQPYSSQPTFRQRFAASEIPHVTSHSVVDAPIKLPKLNVLKTRTYPRRPFKHQHKDANAKLSSRSLDGHAGKTSHRSDQLSPTKGHTSPLKKIESAVLDQLTFRALVTDA